MKQTAQKAAHTPADISVNGLSSFSRRAAASWTMRGARFHVWFNMDSMKLEDDGVIYKNPPLEIDREHPDHFGTRILRGDVPNNAELVRRVFAEIERTGVLDAAIAAEEEKARQEQASRDAYMAAEKLKESAPQLLAERDSLRAALTEAKAQLADCTAFIRQALAAGILNKSECKPLLKQWEAPLKGDK